MSQIQVDNIYNKEATGSPNFPLGANVTGVVTATSFSGSGANLTGIDATALKDSNGTVRVQANTTGAVITGNVSVGGTLTYEHVTNVDSVGVITARDGIKVTGGDVQVGTATTIDNSGVNVTGVVTATSFSGSGADLTGITAGYWGQDSVGLNTNTSVGVNTSTINDKDLQGIGNTFNGMYISNGMMIYDNALSGNHYIGTAFNGLMAGPVTIHGTLSVDGQYVVV